MDSGGLLCSKFGVQHGRHVRDWCAPYTVYMPQPTSKSPLLKDFWISFHDGMGKGYLTAINFTVDNLGSVTRTVLETVRTLFVWLSGLALYRVAGGKVGEAWNQYSWLQVCSIREKLWLPLFVHPTRLAPSLGTPR